MHSKFGPSWCAVGSQVNALAASVKHDRGVLKCTDTRHTAKRSDGDKNERDLTWTDGGREKNALIAM